MGMPDTEMQQYQYQMPITIERSQQVVNRPRAHGFLDWTITMFGAGPVLLAASIGFMVIAKKFYEKWLTKGSK